MTAALRLARAQHLRSLRNERLRREGLLGNCIKNERKATQRFASQRHARSIFSHHGIIAAAQFYFLARALQPFARCCNTSTHHSPAILPNQPPRLAHHVAGLRHTVSSTPYLQHSHTRHEWPITRHTLPTTLRRKTQGRDGARILFEARPGCGCSCGTRTAPRA